MCPRPSYIASCSAALALTARPDRAAEQEAMYEGLGHNCYGSYALEPI